MRLEVLKCLLGTGRCQPLQTIVLLIKGINKNLLVFADADNQCLLDKAFWKGFNKLTATYIPSNHLSNGIIRHTKLVLYDDEHLP